MHASTFIILGTLPYSFSHNHIGVKIVHLLLLITCTAVNFDILIQEYCKQLF